MYVVHVCCFKHACVACRRDSVNASSHMNDSVNTALTGSGVRNIAPLSPQPLSSCFRTSVYPLYRCLQSRYRSVRTGAVATAERRSDYLMVMMRMRVMTCWFVLYIC